MALGNHLLLEDEAAATWGDFRHSRIVPAADGCAPESLQAWGMTGDFLPRRRQASVLSQILTVLLVAAVVALGFWLL